MKALYITSAETFSGKSALCIGLGLRFKQDGLNAGYMKPVSVNCQVKEGVAQMFKCQVRHERASRHPWAGGEETCVLKDPQRLPNGNSAYLKLLGQLALRRDLVSCLELA